MSLSTVCHFINVYNLLPTKAAGPPNKSHHLVGVDRIPSSVIGTASPFTFVHSVILVWIDTDMGRAATVKDS